MNEQITQLSNEVSKLIKPQFEKINEIVEYNQIKVLKAMQKYQLSEAHFFGTSGYGYDDIGREVIEKIRRKPVSPNVEATITGIGFICLLLLMIYVTCHDIIRLVF